MSSKLLLLPLFALFLASPALQAQLSDAQLREKINVELSDHHASNPASWWRGLGAGAPAIMIQMYGETETTYRRVRLLDGLSQFPDSQEAVDFMKAQADGTDKSVIRNAAVRDVATSQGERELEWVSKFLSSADPQTRLAAAQALQGMPGAAAQGRLQSYQKDEKAGWIVAKLNNEPVKVESLKPSGSSEDRPDPRWEGSWSGLFLSPKKGSSGVDSDPATVRVRLPKSGSGDVSVDVVWSKAGKSLKGSLSEIQARASRISGRLGNVPFEANLLDEGGSLILSVRIPPWGLIGELRKD